MSELLPRLRFWFDHRLTPGRLSAYLDGELVGRRHDRVQRHVAECQTCRRLLAGLRAVLDALRRLPAPDDEDAAGRITAAVRVRLTGPPPE